MSPNFDAHPLTVPRGMPKSLAILAGVSPLASRSSAILRSGRVRNDSDRPSLPAVRCRDMSHLLTVVGVTPATRAASVRVNSPATMAAISRLRTSGCTFPLSRPFCAASMMFSWFVPRNRCDGRQQAGVSQRWHTRYPFGTGLPWASSHASRCGCPVRSFGSLRRPYPYAPSVEPVHSQQSPEVSTRDHSRSSAVTLSSIGTGGWPCRFAITKGYAT